MYLKPGGSFAFQTFTNGANGALADADALPTAVIRHGQANDAALVTVSRVSTGWYEVTGAVPSSGYAAGDTCQIVLSATIGGVAAKSTAGEFVVDTANHADIMTMLTTLATSLAAVPGLVWDTLTSAARAAGSYGAKLKAWALGTDYKALLSTDAGNTASLSGGQVTALTPPTPAAILAAFKADADWQTLLANVNGVFDYNETTHVLTLKDKTGTTTLATLTMTLGTAAITHRASA